MNYQTIDEIYAANDKIRAGLLEMLGTLSDEQTEALPEGEKWTIAQLVEHISIVADGMSRISAKLLSKAQSDGKASDGKAVLGEGFMRSAAEAVGRKLEAPEMVRPTGDQTIAESVAKLEESRRRLYELKPLFETVDCSEHKFPHPAFGDLTAHEWLALIGGHEHRHIQQIRRRLG